MRLRNLFYTLLLLIMINGCASVPSKPVEDIKGIAVWDLEDLSPTQDGRPDLGPLLAARITETVKESSPYNVVERERLSLVLQELNLGSAAISDESTRLRLGKLVGADLMIFGGYQVISDTMRLDLRLVEVETGKILKASEKTAVSGDIAGWLNAAGEAAKELFSAH